MDSEEFEVSILYFDAWTYGNGKYIEAIHLCTQ